ncbi:hypothetical protein [Chryseobacterium proteolyticum]|uniref:hypothetical protein n=1 Tax=Chryseobacterium proteolyticum TaxID=118127 RepID=UPI003982F4BE
MLRQSFIFEDSYKKFGFDVFSEENLGILKESKLTSEIKIFFIPPGYELSVDFNHYKTTVPTLFFFNQSIFGYKEGKC